MRAQLTRTGTGRSPRPHDRRLHQCSTSPAAIRCNLEDQTGEPGQGNDMHALEQEVKLDVEPGWCVPDLDGLVPGANVAPPEVVDLDAVYYDTEDGALGAHGITLRLRSEEHQGREPVLTWTLKLPAPPEEGYERRTEVNWEAAAQAGGLAEPGTGVASLPAVAPEVAAFAVAVTLGRALRPIARVTTTRQRCEVRTSDGRLLAEVDHDSVTGTNLLSAGAGHRANTVVFTEVEVELADGSALEVAHAVVERLEGTGARRSARRSKLATVLERTGEQRGAGIPLTAAPGTPPPVRAARPRTATQVIASQARSCLEALAEHDPYIRLGDPDPEHVHKARVATRRLRALLRAAGRDSARRRQADAGPGTTAAETARLADLSAELGWLGRLLGGARDGVVRIAVIQDHAASLPEEDARAVAAVVGLAEEDHEAALLALRDALRSERYLELVRHLADAASPGGAHALAGTASEVPASELMASVVQDHWRSLCKAMDRLGPEPTDVALHRSRVKAKRLRYLAEIAAPLMPTKQARRAETTARRAASLQDVLGEVHDLASTGSWLRELVSRRIPQGTTAPLGEQPGTQQGASPAHALTTAFGAGLIAAAGRTTWGRLRSQWQPAWRHLRRANTAKWAKPVQRDL